MLEFMFLFLKPFLYYSTKIFRFISYALRARQAFAEPRIMLPFFCVPSVRMAGMQRQDVIQWRAYRDVRPNCERDLVRDAGFEPATSCV
jgi:hypothetical protein